MSTATATKVLTDRINRIEVSATMAITAEALRLKATGIQLADFGAGEPHFETPRHIKDAAIDAINKGFTRYTAVAGTPDVRKALVERHRIDFGTDYAVDECVESREDENFRVTAAMIEAAMTEKTKAIILCTPSNPSGAVMDQQDVEAIVRLAHARGVYVLLDECYAYLNFASEPVSGASYTDCKEHVIVLGSLSKTYAMTGWRAGFALGPKQVISAMSKLQSQSTSNTASMVQRASIAALTASQQCVVEMREDYVKLRDRILAGLKTIPGLTCTVPEGAFYVYPNISAFLGKGGIKTASDLASKLLTEAHVVSVPGEPFGTHEHIRLSYAVSGDVIDKGVERIRAFLTKLA
jgi:aspartate aminotransferase